MKTIAVILMLCVAVSAGAGEPSQMIEWQWSDENIAITTIEPANNLTFGDNAGTLTWEGGVFKFSGDPDKSAVVFLDWVQQYYNERAELYCPNNAEIRLLLDRCKQELYDPDNQWTTMTLEVCDTECQLERQIAHIKYMRQLHKDIEAMIERMK